MHYDPIKDRFGILFNKSICLRILFYKILNFILLRSWHIHKQLLKWHNKQKDKKNIMDAGCGFGQYTYFMHKLSDKYFISSADINRAQIEDCNGFFHRIKSINTIFNCVDLTQIDAKDAYHLILNVDVLEHIENDTAVMKIFYDLLKKDGVLIASTPSDIGHDDDEEVFIGEHFRCGYNKKELKQRLKNIGFDKVKIDYTYGWAGHLSWLLSMKLPMQMLNISKLFIVILPVWYLLFIVFIALLNLIDISIKNKSGRGLIVVATK